MFKVSHGLQIITVPFLIAVRIILQIISQIFFLLSFFLIVVSLNYTNRTSSNCSFAVNNLFHEIRASDFHTFQDVIFQILFNYLIGYI